MAIHICPHCGEGITTVYHYVRTIGEIRDEKCLDDEEIYSEMEMEPRQEESFECPECESEFDCSSWEELEEYLTNNN